MGIAQSCRNRGGTTQYVTNWTWSLMTLDWTNPNPFALSEVEGHAKRLGFDFPRT